METTRQAKKSCSERMLISSESKWKSIFDIWILLLVGYSCIFNIFVVAFDVDQPLLLELFNDAVEILFVVDFFLNFFTSFKDPDTHQNITSYKKIALNYLLGWFLIDLVSIFPLQWFLGNDKNSSATKLVRFMRMPRLGKLMDMSRINKLLKSFQGD